MTAVIEPEEPIRAIHIDGLAVLQIVKHCQESLPTLVTGSLLGLIVKDGILEITHAFPFPEQLDNDKNSDLVKTAADVTGAAGSTTAAAAAGSSSPIIDEASALDGHEYQLEMMKMLREVNVDNNCVGWYQSMYLGSYSTTSLLENQLSYQTDLSPNAVALLYDPMQTAHGNLVLKCLRLTPDTMALLKEGKNKYLNSNKIFEEVPIKLKNPSLVTALLHNVKSGQYLGVKSHLSTGHDIIGEDGNQTRMDGLGGGIYSRAADDDDIAPAYTTDTTLDRLDLSTNPYLEKHLEFLSTWVDDLAAEQSKFQYYMRTVARNNAGGDKRYDKRNRTKAVDEGKSGDKTHMSSKEAWASNDAPKRLESLLISNQIRNYCNQIDKFADGGFGKLFVMEGLQKK